VMNDGDHFDTFMRPQIVADALVSFLAAVDKGKRPTRPLADPVRRAEAMRPYAGPIGTRHMGPRFAIEVGTGVVAVGVVVALAWRRRRRRSRQRLQ